MISELTEDGWMPSFGSSQGSEGRYQEKNWRKGKTVMMDPRPVKKDMLVGLVEIRVPDSGTRSRQSPANRGKQRKRRARDPLSIGLVRQRILDTFPCHLLRRGRYAQLGEVRCDSGSLTHSGYQ